MAAIFGRSINSSYIVGTYPLYNQIISKPVQSISCQQSRCFSTSVVHLCQNQRSNEGTPTDVDQNSDARRRKLRQHLEDDMVERFEKEMLATNEDAEHRIGDIDLNSELNQQQMKYWESDFHKIGHRDNSGLFPNQLRKNDEFIFSNSDNSFEDYTKLTHTDDSGKASMVDVDTKIITERKAVASGRVILGETAFRLLKENKLKKGDVLAVSQLAGIMGAKKTSDLIPLCHNIPLSHAAVSFKLSDVEYTVNIEASVRCSGKTGVEMEALSAVSIAALTIYDMCKAVSKDIVISDIKLMYKTGGKSKDYQRK